jgi:enamine deaminase RidA (YjgF/YER057c/UK114 family)
MLEKNTAFERYENNNISASIVNHGSYKEYFITVDLFGLEDIVPSLCGLFTYLNKEGAKVIMQMVFGDCLSKGSHMKKIAELNVEVKWPVLALENDSVKYSPLSGMQFIAVSGVEVEELKLKDKIVGYSFEDKSAKYAYLCDVRPENIINSQKEQTKEVYKKAAQALYQADMEFSNVVRTWFYLDKLLSWYDVFNGVRTNLFNDNNIFNNLVPASTGIGARNREGAAIALCLYAIKPKDETVSIAKVDSPLQCEAINYKSVFSRAVEIKTGKIRKLLISGTASISEEGKSINMCYLNKQIEKTIEIINKILTSKKMSWSDVTRTIVYFKENETGSAFKEYCKTNNIPSFPVTIAYTSVCRDELLFEMELDAVDRA